MIISCKLLTLAKVDLPWKNERYIV